MILAASLVLIAGQLMPRYSVTMVDIGDASPGRVQMNANDELAVTSAPAGEEGTFFWSDGHVTRIEIPDSSDFSGYVMTTGISDKGTIVGYLRNNLKAQGPGIKWSTANGMSTLHVVESDADYLVEAIGAANENIVGVPDDRDLPFLGTLSNSNFTRRASIADIDLVSAPDINCHDVIVGTTQDNDGVGRAFRSEPGKPLVSLPVPPASDPHEWDSQAMAINDSGYVVGFTHNERRGKGWCEGAIWSPKNELTRFHDSAEIKFLGINNQGLVVGRKGAGSWPRAILFDSKSGLWDLNALVPVGTPVLREAYTINDRGTIACSAMDGHLYLLRPISG